MFTLVVFAGVFELDGDEGELEVGEEGGVEPVVAGGGLAVVLHAAEDAFHDVPPLVRLPVIVPWVRAVPLGRRDRRRAERLGQQAGGIPLVGAVHEQLRAHERAERGHGAAPVGRVVLVARAQMDFDERRLAVGYHVNFGVPASPGYADGLRPPFFQGARGVLVDLHARGVHGEHPDLDGDDPFLLQGGEQALDCAVPRPAVEPLVDGDPLAIALRQIPPRVPVLHIHSKALTNV